MKKLMAMLLTILMLLAAMSGMTTVLAEEDDEFLVGCTLMFYDDPYFLDMRNTVKEYCDAEGWGFTEFDAAGDAAAQSDAIVNMIGSGIDALVIAALDADGVVPNIEECNAQGIPVICVDAGINGGEILTLCESDNYQAGVMCGEALVEAIGGKGKICITNSPSGAAARAREEGFFSVVDQYPEIECMDKQESLNQTRGMEIGDTWAIAYPDLAAVFTIDDNSGLGVAAAFRNAGLSVPIFSVDGSAAAAEQILDPDQMYAGTAAQQPKLITIYAMDALKEWKDGDPANIEPHYQVPVFMVTAENAEAYLAGELTTYEVAR